MTRSQRRIHAFLWLLAGPILLVVLWWSVKVRSANEQVRRVPAVSQHP